MSEASCGGFSSGVNAARLHAPNRRRELLDRGPQGGLTSRSSVWAETQARFQRCEHATLPRRMIRRVAEGKALAVPRVERRPSFVPPIEVDIQGNPR